jgi:osmotically-inducible protein OsmY
VSSKDGVVTLQGLVLNQPMRDLAVAIAKNTSGVTQVVDNLSVQIAGPVAPAPRPPASGATPGATATTGSAEAPVVERPDDARITSNIQSKYFLDDRIKGRHINVTSTGGVVTLSGEVADEGERAQALLLARTTDGVTRVEDTLTIAAVPATSNAPAASPAAPAGPAPEAAPPVAAADTDAAVVDRVKSQLSSDARVGKAPIEVTAKNGVVLLQGTVGNAVVKQRALTITRGTDGVTQVVDRIRVRKGTK